MNDFLRQVACCTGATQLHGQDLETVQINLGPRCTLECHHCHIGASPRRDEFMTPQIIDNLLRQLPKIDCRTVELTGGAPELHPQFRELVDNVRALSLRVAVRSNLTIHQDPGMETIAPFLAERRVALTGSLPCYLEENVDRQRGPGTFVRSIAALRRLNGLGYGLSPELPLDLVYNPGGASLPPDQTRLEESYRQRLHAEHGVAFSRLLTITNMPIGRFRADLRRQGNEEGYFALLKAAFNPRTLDRLMCRHQISVRWDGRLFDCDFNLALNLPVNTSHPDVSALSATPATRPIATGEHCLGCTAGAGSSCAGALAA
ncbi:MAG: arsenosugar biosynthesis radical SAM protein ArsS [Magnetococcales bacterium]|nr:arsenosugar biosynthesis radical SAM protein ArsS [Magnetococcales bacterium]